MKHTLDSYEENIQLDSSIISILLTDFSSAEKHKRLTELQKSVHSDLAKSHVEYYKKHLMNNQRHLYKKICMLFLVGIYLLFTIYLITFRIYPYIQRKYTPNSHSHSQISNLPGCLQS